MPRERLKETIEQLRHEIDSGAALSPDQMQLLGDALEEVEAVLESKEPAPAEHTSIVDKLRAAEEHFEESHPNLTMAVGAVAHALSKLGI